MRWPRGIKTSTRTAAEHEARIKDLQAQRLHLNTEELARWHHGDLEWRKQALMDSYRLQAQEGWVVMKTFQPFPVKTLKLSSAASQLTLPEPMPVGAFDATAPVLNTPFHTMTIKRGEGYINDMGELVIVL